MKDADKPENGGWLRNMFKEIKGVRKWHEQIDDLCKELGTEITGDPEHLDKLDAVGKLEADY